MATPFRDIYCLNKLIKNDPRLKKLDKFQYSMLCFGYLKFAISYFMYDCRNSLTDRLDPTIQSYYFDGDGVDDEFYLSPSPTLGSSFYISVTSAGVKTEITDYTYDETTANVKLSIVPLVGDKVEIVAFTGGEFNLELDEREKVVLAEAMNIPYLEEAKNDQNAMKYIVSGKSLRFFSQANHIDSAVGNYNSQAYAIVDGLISEYSYKGSPDRYSGLVKRGRGA